MAAPAHNIAPAPVAPQTHQTASAGLVDAKDIDGWVQRFKEALEKPETVTAPTGPDAQPWYHGFFSCFTPVDTCLITCCVPCVTFGKTHHRLRKDPNLVGYNPVNATCLGFCGAMFIGFPCIPNLIMMADIRRKFNLNGDLPIDFLKSWCCGCCSLIQMDKEVEYRMLQGKTELQYQQQPSQMQYGP